MKTKVGSQSYVIRIACSLRDLLTYEYSYESNLANSRRFVSASDALDWVRRHTAVTKVVRRRHSRFFKFCLKRDGLEYVTTAYTPGNWYTRREIEIHRGA